MSLSIEIVKMLVNNDNFLSLLVDEDKLKNTCFLLMCIIILDTKQLFKEMGTHNIMDLILKGRIKQKKNVLPAQKYGSKLLNT